MAQDPDQAHQQVLRLADEILPALIARIGVSELGEIEIRRGDWRVRLRRARRADPPVPDGQRGETHRRPMRERRRTPTPTSAGGPPPSAEVPDAGLSPSAAVAGDGAGRAPVAVGPGVEKARGVRDGGTTAGTAPRRVVARSPAVGYFVPRDGLAIGHPTRGGDLLGHIDVLGVRQDVVAPADGVVGRLFVEPGEAVEYGQELLRVDPTMSRRAADSPA